MAHGSIALTIAVAAWLSQLTAVSGGPFALLWLPPSLVLIGLIARGYAVIAPAVFGLTFFLLWQDVSPAILLASVATLLVGPIAAHATLLRLADRGELPSALTGMARLCLVLAVVYAPLSALLMVSGNAIDAPMPIDFAVVLAWRWATELTTGVIFVGGSLAWITPFIDRTDSAPVTDTAIQNESAHQGSWIKQLVPIVAIVAMAGGAVLFGWFGEGFIERTIVIPIFGVACLGAIIHPRKEAVKAIMLAGLLNAMLRVEGAKVDQGEPSADVLLSLAEFQALLLVGSVLAHLLAALMQERVEKERQLRHQALTNELTGLPNLRSLNQYLRTAKEQPNGGLEGLVLAELSITGLHQWADVAGRMHATAIEQEVATRIRANCRDGIHAIFHLETGRFVLSLVERAGSEPITESLNRALSESAFQSGDHTVRLQYSVGLVDVPSGSQDYDSILASLAISQRLAALADGGYCRLDLNNERVWAYRQEMEWTETIKHYLESGALRLFAQRIGHVKTAIGCEQGLHYEVLARMVDKDGSILSPASFLPAIAKSGLHARFDWLVVQLVLDTLAQNKALRDLTSLCAINVTGPTICNPKFASVLLEEIARRQLSPLQISIEITESDSLTNLDAAQLNVQRLQQEGMRVAVDDFGTGLATYEYIRKLRPDILKIDGAFVTQYDQNPVDREIVHSIIRLAASIGAETVAEFVEDAQIADRMAEIGVDYLQGWGIAKPIPIADLRGGVKRVIGRSVSEAS